MTTMIRNNGLLIHGLLLIEYACNGAFTPVRARSDRLHGKRVWLSALDPALEVWGFLVLFGPLPPGAQGSLQIDGRQDASRHEAG